MNDDTLLADVKSALGITVEDDDVDRNIRMKISTVKVYLLNAGMKSDISNDSIVGCVAVGVNDLLNNKAGETKFSPAFNILAMQICSM